MEQPLHSLHKVALTKSWPLARPIGLKELATPDNKTIPTSYSLRPQITLAGFHKALHSPLDSTFTESLLRLQQHTIGQLQ